MPSVKNLDKTFAPKSFNESPVSKMLIPKEKEIGLLCRDSENKDIYSNFDEQFKSFIPKLQNEEIKKVVSSVFGKEIVFIGMSTSNTDPIYSRLYITNNNKLSALSLSSEVLNIECDTGNSPSFDDCIYAVYGGLIRAAILTNEKEITNNMDLHKLISAYIYLIFLKSFGQTAIYNDKQKQFLNIVCIFIYFTHFFSYKPGPVISIIKSNFKEMFKKEYFDELLLMLKKVKYTNIKDIPNIIVDLGIYSGTPSKVYLELLKLINNSGFYSLISSLDLLIPMIILSKYSTDLYSKNALTSLKIHDNIEEIMLKYINKIEYEKSVLFY